MATAAEYLRQLIRREGPITFDQFVEVALYHEDGGFFAGGRGAGRDGGDFITSPQVGSLFGALVARALDRWWEALESPDPFVVVEAGAGNGRLARDVARVAPACTPALRYVLVERSPVLRELTRERLPIEPADEALGAYRHERGEDHPVPSAGTGPVFAVIDELPATSFDGVVFANELLDNLPFGLAQFDGHRWYEVLVTVDDSGRDFSEVLVPARAEDDVRLRARTEGIDCPAGSRLPIARGVDDWFRRCGSVLRNGWCCVIDYAATTDELVSRGDGWLRTYAAHGHGGPVLGRVGSQDITADVDIATLVHAAQSAGFRLEASPSQADWLSDLGIDELVEAGKERWEAGAARGDLDALAGRSAVSEAAALTDRAGLGAHRVFVFRRGR